MQKSDQAFSVRFLESLIEAQGPVTLFLINGVKLQGVINTYDDRSLGLMRDGHVQMVMFGAISTIMPKVNS